MLLLDEPTNHLDFDTVEALTRALEKYEGTIITVSHDRGFIGRVANKILEVNNGKLTLFPGTYDEYVWSLQKGFLSERDLSPSSEKVKTPNLQSSEVSQKINYKEERKRIEGEIKKSTKLAKDAELKIQKLEEQRGQINEELLTISGEKAGELAKKLHNLSSEIENIENSLLEHLESIENFEKELNLLIG